MRRHRGEGDLGGKSEFDSKHVVFEVHQVK